MQLNNSPVRYGAIAQTLHWVVALLIIAAYCAMIYHEEFTVKDTPEHLSSAQLHFSLGISAGCFVLLRLLARLSMRQPAPLPVPPVQQKVSVIVHLLLYILMVAMPLSGYLGTGADTDFFGLVTITQFRETGLWIWFSEALQIGWKPFEEVMDEFHHFAGEWILWLLVVVHILAALYHQLVLKDNIMARMSPAGNGQAAD